MKCRPHDVSECAKAAFAAGFEKCLELRPIALSPSTRIQTDKQVGERTIHKGSSLLSPAVAN